MASLSAAQIAGYATAAGFTGEQAVIAVAVALAESGGNPAINAAGAEDSRGLWQINVAAHPSYDRERLYEPAYNAAAAYAISRGGANWQPWSAFKNGSYRRHINTARVAVGAPASSSEGPNAKSGAGIPEIPDALPGIGLADDAARTAVQALFGVDKIGEAIVVGGLTLLFSATGLALVSMGLFGLTKRSPADIFKTVAPVTGVAGAAASIATA